MSKRRSAVPGIMFASLLGLTAVTLASCRSTTTSEGLLTPAAMQADFRFLCENLIDIHPNVYANFPRQEFEAARDSLLEELAEPLLWNDYYYRLVRFVARIRDDHTYILRPDEPTDAAVYLPLRLRWFGDELRIINAVGPDAETLQGARVVSLARLSIAELLARLEGYSFAENEYWVKDRSAERLLERRMLELLSRVTWEEVVPIVVLPGGDTSPVELNLAYVTAEQQPVLDRKDTPYFRYTYLSDTNAIHFTFRRFFDDRVRGRLGEERAAQLGIESAGDFPEFLRGMFQTAHTENADFVIVDLRQNTGGNSILGFQFLEYVDTRGKDIQEYSFQAKRSRALSYEYEMTPWDRVKARILGMWPEDVGELSEPESERQAEAVGDANSVFYVPPVDDELKFEGKLIALISNRTFSSAMQFATVLADNELAVLVGEPTGGKPESFGDVLIRQLPRTGVSVGISWRIFHRPDRSRKDEVSLFPDFEVVTTYEDYKNGVDPVLEYVKQLMLRERSI